MTWNRVKDILQDAHEFGGGRIKRFVLLASAVEVLNSFEDTSKPGKPYNEEDWNPVCRPLWATDLRRSFGN